ncbi:CidA/LrgA family protein [Silvimonas soli]|uniref:CidA/LrgA family protein n=1 Tax=Silvimonas soli TaxID=2980100 RepID=UPI0024B323D8|nr:CidA/LrgA family protein [Silvimonas soli]
MLYGLAIILGFLVAGEAASNFLHLPLPGTVSGMILLLVWCLLRKGADQRVAQAATGLLRYLGLFFLPAGAGLLELSGLLREQGAAMAAVLVLSTAITLLVTALVLAWLLRRRNPQGDYPSSGEGDA